MSKHTPHSKSGLLYCRVGELEVTCLKNSEFLLTLAVSVGKYTDLTKEPG